MSSTGIGPSLTAPIVDVVSHQVLLLVPNHGEVFAVVSHTLSSRSGPPGLRGIPAGHLHDVNRGLLLTFQRPGHATHRLRAPLLRDYHGLIRPPLFPNAVLLPGADLSILEPIENRRAG